MARQTIGQRIDLIASVGWLRNVAACAALVGVGLVTGTMLPPAENAIGQDRVMPPPPAFKSGDQLSVPILRDMATTLHQIDDRLARLEAVFKELTKPRPRGPEGN